MDAPIVRKYSASPDVTRAWGREIGARLRGGEVICLFGPLGAGKTCLTQGISSALGIDDICSPSFVLISVSRGRLVLYHVDAYRLDHARDSILDTGIVECMTEDGVCVIEWADRIRPWLPDSFLDIRLEHVKEGRSIEIRSHGNRYYSLLEELSSLGDTGH